MTKRHNKKLPHNGVDKKGENKIKPKYGYVHGHADACGGTHLNYRNPKEHDKTWSVDLLPSCNYKTVEHDEKDNELLTQLNPGHTRKYTVKGASEHYDTQRDIGVEKTTLIQSGGDLGSVTKADRYHSTGGNVIKGNGAGSECNFNMGSSDTKNWGYVKGDLIKETKGDHHKYHEGDQVSAVKGTVIHMVKEGDYANHVQGGNWDTDISKKARMKTGDDYSIIVGGSSQLGEEIEADSGGNFSTTSKEKTSISSGKDMSLDSSAKTNIKAKEDITIESDSKITLKVGSNSIEISTSGITINGKKVDIKSDGDITTKGSTTKVQGGGQPGLPTTFT